MDNWLFMWLLLNGKLPEYDEDQSIWPLITILVILVGLLLFAFIFGGKK